MEGAYFQVVLSAIREFGFPTVICLWLMWMYMRQEGRVLRALQEIKPMLEQHKEVLIEVNRTLNDQADALSAQTDAVEEVRDELSGARRKVLPLPEIKLPESKSGGEKGGGE